LDDNLNPAFLYPELFKVDRTMQDRNENKQGRPHGDFTRGTNDKTEPLRVIVAEDEYIIALDLKRKLESFGYSVLCTVSSGEAAIAKSNELRPDLLIMDVGLQGRTNGFGAIAAIRDKMHIPVVFVTAYSDEATRLEVAKLESADFVMKPIESHELRHSVEQACKGTTPP